MNLREYENAEMELCVELMYNPKAIKITYSFMQYLEAKYVDKMELSSSLNALDGEVSRKFMGFPIIVDSTIKHPYYEIVE